MSGSAAPSASSAASPAKKPLPRVIDIADVPDNEASLNDESNRSLLRHLIGQLRVGMDLSKVTLPTHVLEPRSLLEKLTDFLVHGDYLATYVDPSLLSLFIVSAWNLCYGLN